MAAPMLKNIFGLSSRITSNLIQNFLPNGSRNLASLCQKRIPSTIPTQTQLKTTGNVQVPTICFLPHVRKIRKILYLKLLSAALFNPLPDSRILDCSKIKEDADDNFKSSVIERCTSWPVTSVRTLVRYSIRKGKKKNVKAITGRYLRLDWGIYIRARAGRAKHLWKKPEWIVERGKYHVFCNKQQSKLFDKMTTKEWKRKRNYVNDPYERYQRRFGIKQETAPKFLP